MVSFDVLLHKNNQLKREAESLVVKALETFRNQVAVFMITSRTAAGVRIDGCSGNDRRTPLRPKMIFRCVEDRDQNFDHSLCVRTIIRARTLGIRSRRPLAAIAAGEKGTGQVTDRGYDDRKVIAAIPKPIV